MRKKLGIVCWWSGTWAAMVAFVVFFYWLLSSDPESVDQALLSLTLIPLTTGPLWALSYFLAGAFWNDADQ